MTLLRFHSICEYEPCDLFEYWCYNCKTMNLSFIKN